MRQRAYLDNKQRKRNVKFKDFIQDNPFRVMGVFTNDSSDIMSINNSRMKAFAVIGKVVSFWQDMISVFGTEPNRQVETLASGVAALSSSEGRLRSGLFWFMNLNATDARALAALARGGDLLEARKIWEDGEQNMSSLQNQLMCCLLKDPRSYSKALQLASTLYRKYGHDFVVTVCYGFEVVSPDQLMSMFLTEIVKASDGDCWWWDKAVKRQGSKAIDLQWTEAKAMLHLSKLQDALNVAKETGVKSIQLHTSGMCHLDAGMTKTGLDEIGANDLDLVFLENVGNLVCPAEFDTGATMDMVILSIPEGDDKPLKYPLIFQKCDLVLINKIDTKPYFDFDFEKCNDMIHYRNPNATIINISALTCENINLVKDYLIKRIKEWGGK